MLNNLNPKVKVVARSLGVIISFIALLIATSFIGVIFTGKPFIGLYYGITGTACSLIAVYVFLRMEAMTFKSIGLTWERRTFARFIVGLLIGAGIFMVMFLALAVFGNLEIKRVTNINWRSVGIVTLALIPLALMEEIAFRSYALIKLNNAFGIWLAQIIIALCFAIYHILNGWGILLSFTGPFVWAFVFGLSALWSKGIAMPTGIHLALNIMQNIGGFKNSDATIFKLASKGVATGESLAFQNYLGLGLHVMVLIVALALTHLYNRQQRSRLIFYK